MSNTLINSNQNSALVSTLLESSQAIVNPFVYNEKNIVPPHSVQIVSVPPLNTANLVANGTVDFDVPKQGVLRRAFLDCIFTKIAAADHQAPTGFLYAFKEIELLSSGRRISLLTTEGIMAKISDMDAQARQSYRDALAMGTTALTSSGVQATRVVLPLDFFFQDNAKYSLVTNFLEPLRVRVKFSDGGYQIDTGNNNVAPTITQCNLMCEYRELPNNYTDTLIEENYGDGMLTQLINQPTYETPKTFTFPSSSETTVEREIEVELKENGAVKSLYLQVFMHHDQNTSDTQAVQEASNKPLPIKNVKFEAGGQVIMDVPGEYLKYWGRSCNDKNKYYSSGAALSSAGDNLDNIGEVLKIDFGLDREDTTNVISFRELSNPKLTITMLRELNNATGHGHGITGLRSKTGTCQVVYETAQLMTTQSSTGRVNLSLSN